MIDWYRLLSDLNVPYRDRGRNTSRKDINICCPFCEDDYGFHLGISLENPTNYYCFRNPDLHSGKSYTRLLNALKVSYKEIKTILQDYDTSTPIAMVSPPEPTNITKKWDFFLPANQSIKCMQYLAGRGFPNPSDVALVYDLRYAPEGRWANRILIPYTESGNIVSWAGRAIKPDMELKMLMQENQHPGLLYIPRLISKNCILVEGQFDALKIVVAANDYSVIAISGKSLTPAKLLRLSAATKDRLKHLYIGADADVPTSQWRNMISMLRMTLAKGIDIDRLPIPVGYKDPGELPLAVIRKWLPQ